MLKLNDGDVLNFGDFKYFYQRVGTLRGRCEKRGDDYQEAKARAEENGHKQVWINPEAVAITAQGTTPEEDYAREGATVHRVRMGDQVELEGRTYTLQPAPNSNVRLEPVE